MHPSDFLSANAGWRSTPDVPTWQPLLVFRKVAMKTSFKFVHASAALGVILSLTNPIIISHASAQSTSSQSPDNSAQNKTQLTTADNQSNAKEDRMMAAQVRKAIVADKDLSTYGHNVKVIVSNGTVTLKGPVKSDDEKQKVAADVASVVPANKVANELTVKQ
jgi:hyperosmotically inducible protein